MSDGNVDSLQQIASDATDEAQAIMAIALALDDGQLSGKEAKRTVELQRSDDPLTLKSNQMCTPTTNTSIERLRHRNSGGTHD